MPEFISLDVTTLRQLLSGSYRFQLPWFQRAYAWNTDEVGRLLTQIWEAASSKPQDPYYLLGTIVIGKEPADPTTDIVDGQQRIMTLTILFSVLRDLETDRARKGEIQMLIAGDTHRFVPQDGCADFYNRYVQAGGATTIEVDEDTEELLSPEIKIMENRDHLKEQLAELCPDAAARAKLFAYLADHCHVVVHAFPDAETAWRWLQRHEETRHLFNATDKLKNSLTQAMPVRDRESCGVIWDECEAEIGAGELYELFGHLRTLKRRKFSGKPLEAELAREFALNKGGVAFMDQRLKPAVSRMVLLRQGKIDAREDPEIATALDRTSWIDDQTWVPAALLWMETRPDDGESALFFKRLERLVWFMRLSGMDTHRKQGLLVKLLGDIDSKVKVAAMKSLVPDGQMRDAARKGLLANSFDRKHYAKATLRLISTAMGHDPGPIDNGKVRDPERPTVEHILPQGKKGRGAWDRDFPARHAKSAAHRLANLTWLSEGDNHALANSLWSQKRLVYAKSAFHLSRELKDIERWTLAALNERAEHLVKILFTYWELK